jgi:hypothetical protein
MIVGLEENADLSAVENTRNRRAWDWTDESVLLTTTTPQPGLLPKVRLDLCSSYNKRGGNGIQFDVLSN